MFNPFTPKTTLNPFKPLVEQAFKDPVKEAQRLIYGNSDYSTKANKMIEKFGNQPIQRITLVRNPVPEYLIEILNVVSFGDFKKKLKETEYDKLFHLAIVFDTPKGRVLLEKNEVINITETIPNEDGREDRDIPINKNLTFKEVLDNTERRLGKDLYYKYSAYDNNCQNFILNLLKANDLGTNEDYEWVKQDTEELFKSNPFLRKLADGITDLASRFTGRGKKKQAKKGKIGGLIVKRNPYNAW